jgi:MFS transporter, ACS family, hexuronate transporter
MTAGTEAGAPTIRVPTPLLAIPYMSWVILGLTTAESILGVIDRQAVAILKPTLKVALGFDDKGYSLLVAAFLIPFSIGYIICGRIVDRYGSRIALTLFATIWSLATLAHGLAQTFEELVAYRAVLGLAEAGLVPASLYALTRWFPEDRWATANSIKAPINAMGPVLAPPVVAFLAVAFGWRWAFAVPAVIGLAVTACWWFADRNPPYARNFEKAEKAPLRSILGNRALWALVIVRVLTDPVNFFLLQWQAGYMQEVLGLTLIQTGNLLWIPPLAAYVLIIPIAAFSDRLIHRGMSPLKSRVRVMQAAALLAPPLMLPAFTSDITVTIVALMLGQIAITTWLFLSNIAVADQFAKGGIGTALGVSNALGSISAALFNLGVGSFIGTFGYAPIYIYCGLAHVAAAVVIQMFLRDRLRAA